MKGGRVRRAVDHRDRHGAGSWYRGGRVPPPRDQRSDFYKWKSTYDGVEVFKARRLRALERER